MITAFCLFLVALIFGVLGIVSEDVILTLVLVVVCLAFLAAGIMRLHFRQNY